MIIIRKFWPTIVVSILSLFVFGHLKNFFGWPTGYIAYSFTYFILGAMYKKPETLHIFHYVVIAIFFITNFIILYSGSEYVFYPVPAIGLGIGAILGYVAGRLWISKDIYFSLILYATTVIFTIIFCNWLPTYFYSYRTNLSVFSPAIQKKVYLNFVDLDGNRIGESVWKDKVVIVDFWYLQCGWCFKKFPLLERVGEHFKKNKNLQIISVVDGSINSRSEVKKFLKGRGFKIPVFYDTNGDFVKKYHLNGEGYPIELKIDRDGVVQEVLYGLWSFEDVYVSESVNHINNLLK